MKPLHLIFLASIVTLSFVSCSSENDDDEQFQNTSIEGLWQPTEAIFVNNSGTQVIEVYDECQLLSRTNFIANGSFDQTGYYPVSGVCEIEWDNSGNWEIVNGNILRVTVNGQVDNGTKGDYLIRELTSTTLKIDADLETETVAQELYIFTKLNQ